MYTKNRPAKVKAVGDADGLDAGQFEAVVSAFDTVDSVGDVVLPGAFADTLKAWDSGGDAIPVVWSHQWDDPFAHVGHVTAAEETDQGLHVTAQLDLDNPTAQQVYRLLKGRRVKEFSFAYDVVDGGPGTKDGRDIYELRKLDLFECGPTLVGANRDTHLVGVKAAIPASAGPSGTSEESWDGPANEARLSNDAGAATYRKAYAWVDPDGDPDAKASYKFIHHTISDTGTVGAANIQACTTGIGVLNGGRGGASVPDADRQGVYAHLAKHVRDSGAEPPELKARQASAPDTSGADDTQETGQPATPAANAPPSRETSGVSAEQPAPPRPAEVDAWTTEYARKETTHMSLREQLQAVLADAKTLAEQARAEGRDFTDDEVTRVNEWKATADNLNTRIKAADEAQANAHALADMAPAPAVRGGNAPQSPPQPGGQAEQAKSFGQAFVDSNAYQGFRKEHPSGFGEGTPIAIDRVKVGTLASLHRGAKADGDVLQAELGHVQPVRLPTVDLTYPTPLRLLDLVSRGTIGGPSFEYLQITAVTRNAGIVPDEILPDSGTLKPTSDLSTNLADAKVFTYADGYTVTNQMLADAPALASYLNGQLAYNVNWVIEDKILNGTGASGEPTGIMNTTGVQQQENVAASAETGPSVPATIRRAITKLQQKGAPITGVVLSPEDNETLDLMVDANQRYYSQGPFGVGPNTIWGIPRVVSQRVPVGTAILGNWATVTLLDREGLSVLAFNQHKDYAQRNLVYVRAELRAAQAVFKPAELCIANLAAGGE